MNSFFTIGIAAALACLSACAKTTDEPGGTNTNWLGSCTEDGECGDAASCLCGVCTKPCEASDECGAAEDATSCQPLRADACGAELDGMRACVQTCDEDEDCTALEEGRCAEGVCVPDDPGVINPDPLALTRAGSTIQITDAYTACDEHSDCVLVETSCNGCCERGAIAGHLTEAYETNKQPACATYEGGECDCSYTDLVPRCVEARCTAVLRADAGCFAPEVDDYPYDPGDIGCACGRELEGKSICTGRASLVCEHHQYDFYVWLAVENGACGEPEPDPTCADGELRDGPDACLAEFDTCHVVESGEYCGEFYSTEP